MKSVTVIAGLLFAMAAAQTITIDLSAYPKLRYDTPVEVKVGEQFEVILAENPTTGYIWEIFEQELKKGGIDKVVRPRRHRYETDENKRGATGVSGLRIFTLEVIGVGKGDLNFIHGRPWETNAKADAGEDLGPLVQKVVPIIAVRPATDTTRDHSDNGRHNGGKDL